MNVRSSPNQVSTKTNEEAIRISPEATKVVNLIDSIGKYYNTFVGTAVAAEAVISLVDDDRLLGVISLVATGHYQTAWDILNDMGLIEKLSDVCVHYFNATISKDSLNWVIAFAMVLDAARICAGLYYGSNQISRIPTLLQYVDLGLNHTGNIALNAMRGFGKYLGIFSSGDQAPVETPRNENVPGHRLT